MMSSIHFVLQGKGGVGKSYVASILAQYFNEKFPPTKCFDTDPVNHTFSQYQSLNAKPLELLKNNEINPRQFDQLITELIADQQHNFIIDNGAASFIPLSSYLLENDILNLLRESGKKVYIHTIITGGQALKDTVSGFNSLATQFKNQARIIIWMNYFFGEITNEGKSFEEMKAYINNKQAVYGMVHLYQKTRQTFGIDIEQMQKARLGFDEAISRPEFYLMTKQRLTMVKRELWQNLNLIPFDADV